ncbi:MAG: hypothetical protein IKY84_07490 [Bacteroidaceae bacterium]|nr:hypothetical protein [Bacteroidaceae bacterium]
MKKTIQLLLVIGMLFACPVVNAQNRAMNKALKKEYKLKKKEFEKGGWTVFGTARSLDVALLKHYEKLNVNENAREIVGLSSGFPSISLTKEDAEANACNRYARYAGSHVRGRVVNDRGGNAQDASSVFEHFYAAYESMVEKEIKGELRECFSIYREIGKDKQTGKMCYEMQIFYILDEDAASAARIRAFENALRESAMAQMHAEMVSKFIQEGFEVGE